MMERNANYSFSVRVKGNNTKEYQHLNDVYIEGRRGSTYELYFQNTTRTRVKVIFSVDGLCVADGKPASHKSQGYIVDAYSSITIPGRTINNNVAAKFKFRPQGDKEDSTYVEVLKKEGFAVDVGNQGVIGCMVFKEKYIPVARTPFPKYQYHNGLTPASTIDYPFDNNFDGTPFVGMAQNYACAIGEPVYASGYNSMNNYTASAPMVASSYSGNASVPVTRSSKFRSVEQPKEKSLGTGFGEDVSFKTTSVTFNGEDAPSWIGVINYDTISNLRKKGIVVDEKPVKSAFPGYNPNGCYIPKSRV